MSISTRFCVRHWRSSTHEMWSAIRSNAQRTARHSRVLGIGCMCGRTGTAVRAGNCGSGTGRRVLEALRALDKQANATDTRWDRNVSIDRSRTERRHRAWIDPRLTGSGSSRSWLAAGGSSAEAYRQHSDDCRRQAEQSRSPMDRNAG
jgi:hypothetical protein